MTTIQDHLAAWGVPERYRDDFNSTLMQCAPYVSLASAVAATIATETGDDDGVADYVSAVRGAFSALIHAMTPHADS